MKPANTKPPLKLWQSPTPYLFGSLAIVLTLIAVALILLLCSYRKRYSNSGNDYDEEKPPAVLLKVLDPEPKVVVIMAGDDQPTYLATPATCSKTCCCEQV
ncbi:Protein GLUTAMINE DUMPER like [Melia azedarach]|uniref:Protein GLUTAMINE DUMPER like n=1 Tax=Melia azedarach TaxID=155640 RepID=A0ACC1X8A9_MELAZ|nr:Protein GLUTAMINE DUMPER like [Melia azedarach]